MTKLSNSNIEVDVIVKVRDDDRGELVDAISATSKLTKADAGISDDEKMEDAIYISITPGKLPKYADAIISVNYSGKLTKADAG